MKRSDINGFSLVEVSLALGVAAFCLVSIFGLLPVGVNSTRASIEQTAANGILSIVISDLRATPPTVPPGLAATSQELALSIPANPVNSATTLLPVFFAGDGRLANSTAERRYRLGVRFIPNGTAPGAATFVHLKVSWPAAVDPAVGVPSGYVEMFTALDRNQ